MATLALPGPPETAVVVRVDHITVLRRSTRGRIRGANACAGRPLDGADRYGSLLRSGDRTDAARLSLFPRAAFGQELRPTADAKDERGKGTSR